ncbi:unnamed protein product, partial [Adineta steineri]
MIGPAMIRALTHYIEDNQQMRTFDTVRHLCITGEAMKPQQWTRFVNLLSSFHVELYVHYGTSESNGALGCQLINIKDIEIPIGYPMPAIQCLLVDDDDKIIKSTDSSNKIGQIHIGGPTLFNSYLNDPEKTASKFTTINNQVYIKTGDLARYNTREELVYAGRTDFQIKIRGQRVETSEIENTITNSYPSKISDCVVTKLAQNDDLLVAYVVSKDSELDTEQIRNYCNKHLYQYMVPSFFVFLEQLPLNVNGKIDRKNLPMPDFSSLATIANDHRYIEPMEKVEILVHSLWCEILGHSRISTSANFFSIGGHSLLFIQLYQGYKTTFDIDISMLDIGELFQHPTIANHAHLISQSKNAKHISEQYILPARAMEAQMSSTPDVILIDNNLATSQHNFTYKTDETSSYQSCATTEIQQAYLFGRRGYVELGQVSCYSYEEYDLPLQFNIEGLEQAWNHLIHRHEALRTIFISDTEQQIFKITPYYTIPIVDLSNTKFIKDELIKRRKQLSHQIRPANQWPLFDIQ